MREIFSVLKKEDGVTVAICVQIKQFLRFEGEGVDFRGRAKSTIFFIDPAIV